MFPIRSRLAPFSFIVLIASSTFLTAPPTSAQAEIASTTELEADVLAEINRLRTNPPRYAQWLGTLRRYYRGTTLKLPGEAPVATQEGIAALEEAIAALETTRPVLPLTTSAQLNQRGRRLLAGQPNLEGGETLLNHETPLWSILQLAVSDGDRSRQSRDALLSVTQHTTGIACDASAFCVVSYDGQTNVATLPVLPSPTAVALESPLPTPEIAADTVTSTPEAPTVFPEPSTPISVTPAPIPEVANPELPAPEPTETLVIQGEPDPSVSASVTPTETPAPTPEFPTATPIAVLPVLPNASTNARDIAATTAEVRSLTTPETEVINPTPVLAARSLTPVANLLTPSSEATDQGYLLLLEGALENGDSRYADGSLYDEYLVQGGANQAVTINLKSTEFDTFLAVFDAEGQTILAQNDDAEDSRNSQVTLTLPEAGLYRIFVNGYNDRDRGEYTITIR